MEEVVQQLSFALQEFKRGNIPATIEYIGAAAKKAEGDVAAVVALNELLYTVRQLGEEPAAESTKDNPQCPTKFYQYDYRKALDWEKIIGLTSAKEQMRKSIINPLRFTALAKGAGAEAPNVLMYGPGGTGKTTLVEAIAKQTFTPLYEATAGQIKGQYVGQSEKCMEELLKVGRENRAIVFLDEADALLAGDGNIESAFQAAFKQIVQPGKNMPPPVLIAATNVPWSISDRSIIRRFGLLLLIPLPTREERRELFEMEARRASGVGCSYGKIGYSAAEWGEILNRTIRFSPDDMRRLFISARRDHPVSLSNIDSIYVDEAGNATSENTGVRVVDLPDERQEKVCWPPPRAADVLNNLAQGTVRSSNTVASLERFRQYALQENDLIGAEAIAYSIDEEPVAGGGLFSFMGY